MSVDGIGSGGRNVGSVGSAAPAAAPSAATGPSEVGRTSETEGAAAPSALERLGRGEITLDQYLDVRVSDAVRHLEGRMPAEQMEFLRAALRDSLASDPVLAELVRRATGSVPPARAD